MPDKLRRESLPELIPATPAKKSAQSAQSAHWTPERRAAHAEIVKRQMKEGKLGSFGTGVGGKKGLASKRRFLDSMADKANERAEQIAGLLDKMLESNNKVHQLAAIDRYARYAEIQAKNEREHERALREMTPEQVKAMLLERLFELGIVDGSAEEGQAEITEGGNGAADPSPEADELRRLVEERLASDEADDGV